MATLFFPSAHPCVRRPSICPSRCLLKYWVIFNQTCYITSPVDKGVREHHYFFPSVCPCVHLSVTLSPPKLESIKLVTPFVLMVRLCESNIIFLCIHPPVRRCLSIYPSRYLLLNHRAEFFKLATSLPLMVSVCKSNNIFLACVRTCFRCACVRPSVRHAISPEITWRKSTKLAI